MSPAEALNRGLDVYRAEMRGVIRETLQQEFGGDWCKNQVAPLFGGGKARRIEARLARGERPENLVDVGEFAVIIATHQSLFPEAIRTGEHHNHMSKIASGRNKWLHASREVYRAEAEELLGWCCDVLETCSRHAAASEIRDLVSSIQLR